MKKTDSLLFRFALIFLIFTIVTLLMSGVNTYINQTASYHRQCEENLQNLATYLEELLVADGKDFAMFQEHFLKHYDKILVPHDFSGDYRPAQAKFEELFAKRYPGKTLGVDIQYSELAEDVRMAHSIYTYEYWLNTFEKARDAFHLKYVYYIVPTGEHLHMYWMLDALREEKIVDGASYIELCTDVYEPLEEHEKMWEAWNTGKSPTGYDTYDNEYGRTYAYYTPLIVDGKKIGVIGTEVEIDVVNRAIFYNTLKQLAGMGAILMLCVLALLWFIHRRYIEKLSRLQSNVREYAEDKNPIIADQIEQEAIGKDEIAALSLQVSSMIWELEDYMRNLLATTQELDTTKKHVDELSTLANKDALTGIRNKKAYDSEIRRLEWEMQDGFTEFGIAMIDLNFLKRINDTYGHEQGNVAIKKLCRMSCLIFQHSPVFRIGGDEFVVILLGDDYKNVDVLMEEFNRQLDEMKTDAAMEPWERISASIGYALYDPEIDSSVANIFKRADKAMYVRKKEMHAIRLI